MDFHDIGMVYPALDISLTQKEKDEIVMQLVLDALSDCRKVKEIILGSSHPVERVLSAVKSVWADLRRIHLGGFQSALPVDIVKDIGSDDLDVVIDNQEGSGLDQLLQVMQNSERPFSVFPGWWEE